MIYSTELNAPTPEHLVKGEVPLEGLWWTAEEPDRKRLTPYQPTVPELLEYMDKYDIPRTARIEYYACGSHTVSLVWDVSA